MCGSRSTPLDWYPFGDFLDDLWAHYGLQCIHVTSVYLLLCIVHSICMYVYLELSIDKWQYSVGWFYPENSFRGDVREFSFLSGGEL